MHAKTRIHIASPVERVDSIASTPDNWARYVVGMGEPEEILGCGEVGTRARCPMHMAGRAFQLTYQVSEYERGPDGEVHWRAEISGDSRGWETLDLSPEDGGTRAVAEIEVEPLQGLVYRIAARLFAERVMKRNYQQTFENLKHLAESS